MKNVLMNIPMAKATIEDRKKNTRRAIKGVDGCEFESMAVDLKSGDKHAVFSKDGHIKQAKPRYQIGETIWVREPAKIVIHTIDCNGEWFRTIAEYIADGKQIDLDYDDIASDKKWFQNCQGIPNGCIKEMARIFLKVTNVRVERIRNICIKDMIREGYPHISVKEYEDRGTISDQENITEWFKNLWNKTAPKGYKWEDNPYVFVYEFERVAK